MNNQVLTPQDVADMLKISKCTVYELIKRKELSGYKVGNKLRIDISDVEEYKLRNRKNNNINTNEFDKISDSNNINENIKLYNKEKYIQKKIIICGQDTILDVLSRHVTNNSNGAMVLRAYEGSYSGLCSLYREEVHAVASHIWDCESGEYNIPFVKKMLPGIPAIAINLCYRIQGFYVAKGNPKFITGWEDLKREDIKIVNREPGSGSRILLDGHLMKMNIKANNVKGYEKEVFSPTAVASIIARGDADIGIGTERGFIHAREIDFIPVQKERYDLIMRKDRAFEYPFKAILEILSSDSFKDEMMQMKGYDMSECGKIVGEI